LGWITSDDELTGRAINDVDPEAIAQVSAAVAEDKLRELVREATEGRVAREILTPAGLYAVSYLAASIVNDEVGPADALVSVLNAMSARIGSRPGQWLNSLALIGRRIAGEDCSGYAQFYADNGQPKQVDRPVPTDRNLQTLVQADHAKTLAPRLLHDPVGLLDFLSKNGGEEALEIMVSILWRHAIDGKPVSSVTCWNYFEPAIAQERAKQKLAQEGIRPGDLMGTYRHYMGEPVN
jgi:hypothetical protein